MKMSMYSFCSKPGLSSLNCYLQRVVLDSAVWYIHELHRLIKNQNNSD